MAHIVELREMSDTQLEDMLEEAREEMFNLRFQIAGARLENTTRIRTVRRDIAQIKEVLHKRDLAIIVAANHPDIAALLEGEDWQGQAHYSYEDAAWSVTLLDSSGSEIASALVNLNKKTRRGREEFKNKPEPSLVTHYEVTR